MDLVVWTGLIFFILFFEITIYQKHCQVHFKNMNVSNFYLRQVHPYNIFFTKKEINTPTDVISTNFEKRKNRFWRRFTGGCVVAEAPDTRLSSVISKTFPFQFVLHFICWNRKIIYYLLDTVYLFTNTFVLWLMQR